MFKNADELFYFLGYSQLISSNKITFYKYSLKGQKYMIIFDTKKQLVTIKVPEGKCATLIIEKEEIKAIYMKEAEMGWFNC